VHEIALDEGVRTVRVGDEREHVPLTQARARPLTPPDVFDEADEIARRLFIGGRVASSMNPVPAVLGHKVGDWLT